ncbi:hypothetical protein [Rhizobium sp. P38BS-XIX]|uniref:hypothetical protein n=1 Tax=Rhizobium sp. P38BS-XIX TaxID=2726740 RepID=UPI0019812553|nr:hypothetical protein [Rhizobium sp. P38BS-XIX]
MADLVSRKPKSDSHDDNPTAAPTIALEDKSAPQEEQPSHDTTAVDRSIESGSEAQVETNLLEPDAVAPASETEAEVAEAPAAAGSIEKSAAPTTSQQSEEGASARMQSEAAETLVKRAPARRKNVNPIAEPVAPAIQTGEFVPALATAQKSFADEMADLEEEVVALRRQLAKKLNEQNAQLRKMLARFDGR